MSLYFRSSHRGVAGETTVLTKGKGRAASQGHIFSPSRGPAGFFLLPRHRLREYHLLQAELNEMKQVQQMHGTNAYTLSFHAYVRHPSIIDQSTLFHWILGTLFNTTFLRVITNWTELEYELKRNASPTCVGSHFHYCHSHVLMKSMSSILINVINFV